jgi:hypothetical protein
MHVRRMRRDHTLATRWERCPRRKNVARRRETLPQTIVYNVTSGMNHASVRSLRSVTGV